MSKHEKNQHFVFGLYVVLGDSMKPFSLEHVNRWRLTELLDILGIFEDNLAEAIKEQGIVIAQDYRNILLRFAAKSIVSTREICILCDHGYPDGALGISRSLYEHFIFIAFFASKRSDPDFDVYVNDYFLDSEIQICKLVEVQKSQMTAEEAAEIATRKANAKAAASRDTRPLCWWTGLSNFQSVVEYVHNQPITSGLENLSIRLQALYKLACSVLHSNCFGNQIRLGLDDSFAGIDTSPLTSGHEFSLEFTATTLIFIIGAVCTEFGLDHKPYTERLNDLAAFYKNTIATDSIENESSPLPNE